MNLLDSDLTEDKKSSNEGEVSNGNSNNNDITKNKESNSKFQKILSYYPIAILALVDTVMVLIPTYLENFLPNLNQNIHLSQGKYTDGLATYGISMIFMNLAGAYFGGKFKARTLILCSLFIQIFATVWYGSLMLQKNENTIFIQWCLILFVFSFAIGCLIWGPMWVIIKNHGTQGLIGKEREKRVARNNGIEGTIEGCIGLTIAIVASVLTYLSNKGSIPMLIINGQNVSAGFLFVIAIVLALTILATVLSMKFIRPTEDQIINTFSLKKMGEVLKNWKLWLLGFVILGVFMLQMELSAIMNYLTNVFLILPLVVSIAGSVRTYVMRILVAGWIGRRADRAKSYLKLLLIGLLIGICFIITMIFIPGFSGNDISAMPEVAKIIVQVFGIINLLLLGALTWCCVTIRWSPIGTELGIDNESYASAVALLSAIGFSPGLYFKFIKGYFEKTYTMPDPFNKTANAKVVCTREGNQLILATCAALALFGFISGCILYYHLYLSKNAKLKKIVEIEEIATK